MLFILQILYICGMKITDRKKTKAWIHKNGYHGLVLEIARELNLSRQTITHQLKPETTKVSASTDQILIAAVQKIKAKGAALAIAIGEGDEVG